MIRCVVVELTVPCWHTFPGSWSSRQPHYLHEHFYAWEALWLTPNPPIAR